VGESVMMDHYVKETDNQMRQKSNRMFRRILASLEPGVAFRYGHVEAETDPLKERIKQAAAAEDWETLAVLTAKLKERKQVSRTG